MNWWDNTFSDVGWQERKRRAEVVGDLEKGDTAGAVQRLFALDQAQASEIESLRLTVRVLTEILVENMGLDAGLLHQRMTEAVAESRTGKNTQVGAAPEGESDGPAGRARCTICSAPADVASTNFAEFGLVCDACHAVGKPIEHG